MKVVDLDWPPILRIAAKLIHASWSTLIDETDVARLADRPLVIGARIDAAQYLAQF